MSLHVKLKCQNMRLKP